MDQVLLKWPPKNEGFIGCTKGDELNILFLTHSLLNGGAEIRTALQAVDAAKRGASVCVLYKNGLYEDNEVHSGPSEMLYKNGVPFGGRGNFDEHLNWADTVVWWGSILQEKKFDFHSVYCLSSAWHRIHHLLRDDLIDTYIFQSSFTKNIYNHLKGRKSIVWNGIKDFNQSVDYRTPVITYIGRYDDIKNTSQIISTAKHFRDMQFRFFGSGNDFRNMKRIKNLYRLDNVEINGFVMGDDKVDALTSGNIFVMLSDSEGMPTSLIEAASVGNLCITPHWGSDIRHILKNNIRGRIIRSTKKSLTNAIRYSINNWDESVKIAKAGQKYVNQFCTEKRMLNRYWNMYFRR